MMKFAKIAEEAVHANELAARTHAVLKLATEREQRFRETFERAAVGIVHTAPDGRLMRINRRTCEMLGYAENELKGVAFIDITHADDIPQNAQLFQQLLAGEIDRYQMEKRFIRKDGSVLWADLSVTLTRDSQEQPDYMIAVIEDVCEKKRAEAELIRTRDSLATEVASQTRQLKERNQSLLAQVKKSLEFERAQRRSEQRTRTIANAVPAMIGYWNRELICEFANEAYRQWAGIDPAKIVGMSMRDLMGEKLFRSFEPHALLALEGHEQRFERTMKKADGSISFIEGRYIPELDEFGAIRGFYAYVADITRLRAAHAELEALNAKLHRDSTTDYLTGIANRRVFSERSEEAARKCQILGEPYGLILIDLDNFKLINDGYGHDVGDDVLRAIGRVLKEQLRGREDIGARLGGEEFAVLCFGEMNEDSLTLLAERIRGQVNSETVHSAKGPVKVTCSFGLALSQTDDSGWKNIYGRADAGLYEAKAAGKDRVVFGRSCVKGATGRFRSIRIERISAFGIADNPAGLG
jgi:diguanylate cyclase (GGDEF)-like protein/PAS domain S-box-containing protein